MKPNYLILSFICLLLLIGASCKKAGQEKTNVVIIYIDDLGFGDVSCYGATEISTPNIDKLASNGLLFTNGHCSSATCTPSRYSMLTGEYAWREKGTGIARGDASMIIEPGRTTIATIFKDAGYTTGVVGKWHLGLGPQGGKADWNGVVKPGPLEIGFDYCFLIPATGDRVPCVFIEDYKVVNLDPDDPIQVSFDGKVGDEPTGKENPELLKMHPSHGHDNTIINGISRIGFMAGGKSARWVDEDIADVITGKAVDFIEKNKDKPFFLYFSTHDIHVPRVPNQRFVGKSGMGPRGDAILQMDWSTGQIMAALERNGLGDNTIVIFTSDNGPVVDDGYKDEAVEKLGNHKPAGPLRGGKYSAFDAGTRVPFIVWWPGQVKPGTSDALVGQVDFLASFAAFTKQDIAEDVGPDSFNSLKTLLGESKEGRPYLIEHADALSIIKDNWKYIEPNNKPRFNKWVNIELGNDTVPQLYNLALDIGEKNNVALEYPELVKELSGLLQKVKEDGRSR
ncbi:MAG: arylsulfatase [Chlorobi bacterium]|nr:arylsulfatase [Chlorobiota bacterium]